MLYVKSTIDPFLKALSEQPDLFQQVTAALDANTRVITELTEQLSNTRLYEEDAAKYLGVEKKNNVALSAARSRLRKAGPYRIIPTQRPSRVAAGRYQLSKTNPVYYGRSMYTSAYLG